MGSLFVKLDKEIQIQIEKLMASEGRTAPDDKELFARQWMAREEVFTRHAAGLILRDTAGKDKRAAFLVLTVSGSLLGISPDQNGSRSVIYYSSGLRKKIPEQMVLGSVHPVFPVVKGEPMLFSDGPIKKTSDIYRIACFPESENPTREGSLATIRKKTLMITREWEELTDG